jgi:hypothetical protein
MCKIRMMCLYILLAGNVNAADMLNGLLDQLGGFLSRRAERVIERVIDHDIESNVKEEIVLLNNTLPSELTINGKRYVEAPVEALKNQESYFLDVMFVLGKCRKGDLKSMSVVGMAFMSMYGVIRLFV